MSYTIRVTDREGKIVQEVKRKSYDAACKVWDKAIENISPLSHKLYFIDDNDK
jgi:hypothetical protein